MDYRVLVESSVDVICQVRVENQHARFVYASPSALQVLGWTSEEMQHIEHRDLFPEASMAAIRDDMQKLRQGENTNVVAMEVIRKDGRSIWMENRVRVLRDDDVCREFVVCMRDMTERKKLEDSLGDLVLVDGLTGVGNRRAFDHAVEREWQAALENGRPLSLVMMDVDHFKRINDQYGHLVGDECLRTIAGAVRRRMESPLAFVARYGGEELAVLLPETSTAVAMATAQDLCCVVRTLQTRACQPLTVSCGVSTATAAENATDRVPERLVAAADLALYEAKRLGRNRVRTRSLACL